MKRSLFAALACLPVLLVPSTASATAEHSVTFFSNGSSGVNESASEVGNATKALTSFNSLVPAFTNAGYVFLDWNTSSNGSGTTYSNGASYSFASNLVLYAQWVPVFHGVTFLENRTTSDSTLASETKNSAAPLTLFSKLNPSFSNPGYAFVSWNTKANGSGASYLDGATYSFKANIVLYAQWTKVIATAIPLTLVGVVGRTHSPTTIQELALAISSKHFHRIEVVQVGRAKGGLSSVTALASSLVKLILQRAGHGVTMVVHQVGKVGNLNFAEVFAS